MTCTISLGGNDDLVLRTPSGRELSVPIGPHSTQLLFQILWNSTLERKEEKSAARFMTQHELNLLAKTFGVAKEEQTKEEINSKVLDKFGFDLKELDIDL